MNKQTLTFVVIAAALAALLLVFENPFKGERPTTPREEEKVQLFTPISEEECSRIEVSGFASTTTLVRRDHQWFTGDGYKADPDALESLIKTVGDITEPELISINPDAFIKFRVDPFLGTHLRMFDTDGKVRVDLIIGELQNDFFRSPVRRPDSNKVFRVKAMFRGVFQRPTWRDQNIFRLNAQDVRRVAVRLPDESYAVMQETTTSPWHFCEPTSAPADVTQVQQWAWRIARLRAIDLQPTSGTDLTTFGLTAPTARLSVSLATGSSYTLIFGRMNPANNQYYARRLDDLQVYRVDQRTYADIVKKSAELKPKPELPPPAVSPTTPTVPAITPPVPPGIKRVPQGPTTGTARTTAPTTVTKRVALPTTDTARVARPTTGTTPIAPLKRTPATSPAPPPALRGTPPPPAMAPSTSPAVLKKMPPKEAPREAAPAAPPAPKKADKPTSGPVGK